MKAAGGSGRWPRIAIIGSGFAGLAMAIRLKQAGIDDFTLYEKAASLGGTWRDNRYPGSGCDVPSHLYCFSFAPKADWSRKYSDQAEILGYMEDCAARFGINPHIRFNADVSAAAWDDARACWRLDFSDGGSLEADMLIAGCGQLNRPHIPDIKARDSFRGAQFHSARWPRDFDPSGKAIAIIGTGASAIQFIPELAKTAKSLTIFQRSANWIIPRNDKAYGSVAKWCFRHLPFWRRLYRSYIYWLLESRFLAFGKDAALAGVIEGQARRHMRKQVSNDALWPVLTPDYPVGCKRILISDDIYPALDQPHVRIETKAISAFTEDGVLTGDGARRKVDAVIFATGFKTTDFLAPIHITGKGGQSLEARWRDGAEAYLGLTVAGFPNLGLLYGPNTNLGHNSIIFMIEQQTRVILRLIKAMRAGKARVIDTDAERMAAYNQDTQRRLARSVWSAGCGSWYKIESGKIVNNWPGFTIGYWRRLRRVRIEDFRLD